MKERTDLAPIFSALLLFLFLFFSLAAVSPSPARRAAPTITAAAESTRQPFKSVTRHTCMIGGKQVEYIATVEETFSLNAQGERVASLVSISYVRTGIPDAAHRPVIFAFNGGPGSASLWSHMGLLGPRRVFFQDNVNEDEVHPRTTPPFLFGNNTDSLLDVADVVIFDPPGTGFSRVLGANNDRLFYGVQQDAKVTCEFIEDWVARNERWNSPKFLMGESYGTVRAAEVAYMLAGGPLSSGRMDAVTLNGVMLLGQAMNWSIDDGDTGFLNALPTLAATAWYHGKVNRENKSLDHHINDARAFVSNDYLRALYAGATLSPEERSRIADRLAALIGVSQKFILENNLRVEPHSFSTELLRAEGKQLGLYDGRFTLPLGPSGQDPVADDPAMAQYVSSFVVALNEYLKKELRVEIGIPYNVIEFKMVNAQWDYGSGPGIPANKNYARDLAVAMRRNPSLRLFVGTGYFDLVTTVGSAEYTIAHEDMDTRRVSLKFYQAGHMPYIGVSNRKALAHDLRQFIAVASGL